MSLQLRCASLSKLKKRLNKGIRAVSTKTLEILWKNSNSQFNQIISFNGGHMEPHKKSMKLPQYIFHNTYGNHQIIFSTL